MSGWHSPEVGDRYQLRDGDSTRWDVQEIACRSELEVGGKRERAAVLRPAGGGGPKRIVATERLMLKYEFMGNFRAPAGYRVFAPSLFGQGYLFVTPAGNVEGPPAGKRWTELEACSAAKAYEAAAAAARRATNNVLRAE